MRPAQIKIAARAAMSGMATVAALTASMGRAQVRPDPELSRLRSEFEKGLANASRVVDDIHRLTLRQLERERAEAGDYETAARVKDRLDALQNAPGAAAIVPPPLVHTLTAARALTRDGANSEGGREFIDFRKAGGKAVWDLIGLEKGDYEVYLTYSVGLPRFDETALSGESDGPGEPPGGMVRFGEVSGLGGGPASVLEKRLTTTGSWDNYVRESIGRHEIKNATATVKVEAATATTGGLMRLRQVELVKVVDPESVGREGAAAEPTRVLQSMRVRHQRELEAAAAALRPRFAAEWLKLEQELAQAGEAAAAADVSRSRERFFPAASGAGAGSDGSGAVPGMDPQPEDNQP